MVIALIAAVSLLVAGGSSSRASGARLLRYLRTGVLGRLWAAPGDLSRGVGAAGVLSLYELQKYIVIEQGRKGNPAAARRYKQQVLGLVRERL